MMSKKLAEAVCDATGREIARFRKDGEREIERLNALYAKRLARLDTLIAKVEGLS